MNPIIKCFNNNDLHSNDDVVIQLFSVKSFKNYLVAISTILFIFSIYPLYFFITQHFVLKTSAHLQAVCLQCNATMQTLYNVTVFQMKYK